MPRFAANLSFLFTDLPLPERYDAARIAGFEAVEMLFPYSHPAEELGEALNRNGLTQALFNLSPGDWDAGERGMAALPGREAEFEATVEKALPYARALDCKRLHVLSGVIPDGLPREEAERTYAANLGRAADILAREGITAVTEPLNDRDAPGYLISRTDEARRVIELAGRDNVGLQFDLYHRQIMEGDLSKAIRENADITRHIQIANPPDRTAPGEGEIDFDFLFQVIDETGYDGWIGCEFKPGANGLAWFEAYRPR